MTSRPRMLYLLRHAKSSWSDDGLDDHDRPLAKRGEEAVVRLRRHIAGAGVAPELVLCSSARRTTMTLEGIAPAFPASTTIVIEEGVYGAPADRLLARLHDVGDDLASVLLIGHNPGLESLAVMLVGHGAAELRRRIAEKFPTGALASLAFDGGWHDLAAAGATLQAFVVPREL